MHTDNPTLLLESIALLERLTEILDTEQSALQTPDLNGLQAILEEKQEKLELLASQESHLLTYLQEPSTDENVTRLSNLLQLCRQRNDENQALTLQGMKQIDRSIHFLRSMMQAEENTTYDTSGKTGSSVDKRNLGLA